MDLINENKLQQSGNKGQIIDDAIIEVKQNPELKSTWKACFCYQNLIPENNAEVCN